MGPGYDCPDGHTDHLHGANLQPGLEGEEVGGGRGTGHRLPGHPVEQGPGPAHTGGQPESLLPLPE